MNFSTYKIKFSIIIATYNSMKLLPKVIDSINSQKYDLNKIEIIAVDGGSSDDTLNYLYQNKIKVIDNPLKDPVNAKYLGLKEAVGNYIVFLDHDEVINNQDFFLLRSEIFSKFEYIKVILPTGYVNPKGSHPINHYINEFGDPFSFFIYGISKHKDFFINSMKNTFQTEFENTKFIILNTDFQKFLPLIELLAGASCFDRDYVKKKFKHSKLKPEFLTHLFYEISKEYPKFVITKKDSINHYSSDKLSTYLNKIKWRIVNNIFLKEKLGESGFSGREKYHSNNLLKIKKYMFIPYSLSVVFPLIDSIILSFTRKNLIWLIHTPLCVFTSLEIVYNLVLKTLGFKPVFKTYDGKDKINNKK